MEGIFWLLLQTLPLLTAAAFIFFILGWRWRGQKSQQGTQIQTQQIDAENIAAELARQERDSARNQAEKLQQTLTQTQAELKESLDRQIFFQKEILRLSDDLKLVEQSPLSEVPPTELEQQSLAVEREAMVEERKAIAEEREALGTQREALLKLQQDLEEAEKKAPAKKPRATKKAKPKAKKAVPPKPDEPNQ